MANANNTLAGQTPGVRLDPVGLEQSKSLVETLGPLNIDAVIVSPLERCIDTISPWITKYGARTPVHSEPRIIEPDYGLWSGRNLDELAQEKLWIDVQQNPESVCFPNGERFKSVWDRVAHFLQTLREHAKDQNVIVVSHGDIIKFLLAQSLKMDFKDFQSIVVEPASISILRFDDNNIRVIQVNRSTDSISSMVEERTKPLLGGEVK
jgi:broad specificity phosphatase PhoE